MTRELTGDPSRPVSGGEVVDGADVVETTAGDVVSRGGVGAGHDPGGAQGDGVDLVGGVGVPDDELAVLGGRDEMAAVGGPVHGVDFGEMALEIAARAHPDSGEGVSVVLGDLADYQSC